MTAIEPITPAAVEGEILRLSALLDHATSEIAKRGRDAAEKRMHRDLSVAKAYVAAEGTVDAKKATARIECADVVKDAEIADAVLRNARDAAHNIRSQLDALRSVNASLRHLT